MSDIVSAARYIGDVSLVDIGDLRLTEIIFTRGGTDEHTEFPLRAPLHGFKLTGRAQLNTPEKKVALINITLKAVFKKGNFIDGRILQHQISYDVPPSTYQSQSILAVWDIGFEDEVELLSLEEIQIDVLSRVPTNSTDRYYFPSSEPYNLVDVSDFQSSGWWCRFKVPSDTVLVEQHSEERAPQVFVYESPREPSFLMEFMDCNFTLDGSARVPPVDSSGERTYERFSDGGGNVLVKAEVRLSDEISLPEMRTRMTFTFTGTSVPLPSD